MGSDIDVKDLMHSFMNEKVENEIFRKYNEQSEDDYMLPESPS